MDYTSPVSPEQEALLEKLYLAVGVYLNQQGAYAADARQLLAEFVVRVQAEALEGAANKLNWEDLENRAWAKWLREEAAQLREQA